MSDAISLQRKVPSLEVSPRLSGISKIVINLDNENQVNVNNENDESVHQIVVGDDTGETLEYTDPFGTREQAERQLARLQAYGFRYQPYKAPNALLDPAAEIGDAVSVNNIYGGIYKRSRQFTRLMRANVEAPHQEEIDHEFEFTSPTERHYQRQLGDLKASLLITNAKIRAEVSRTDELGQTMASQFEMQSNRIDAKVSQTGGNNASFGWSLLSDEFGLFAGSKEVFKATSAGVEIDGKVTAREGYIGDESNGFTITATAIYNKISSMGSTLTSGVYIGTDGIRLGDKFQVDAAGNLTCKSADVQGSLRAKDIQYGGSNGTFSGSGITGGSIGTGQMTSYCSGGISGGVDYNGAVIEGQSSSYYPSFFSATKLSCSKLFVSGGIQARIQGSWYKLVKTTGKALASSTSSILVFQPGYI